MKFDVDKNYNQLLDELGFDKDDISPEENDLVMETFMRSLSIMMSAMEDCGKKYANKSEEEAKIGMGVLFDDINEKTTNYFLKLNNNFN